MRWLVLVTALTAASGCATEPPAHPLIPRRAMYSGPAAMAGAGGVATAAIGAHMTDTRRSPGKRKAGAALVAAGAALMGVAVADAIRVQAEREMLYEFDAAWRRDMQGRPGVDSPLPPPLPPPPVNPWEYRVDSPLGGAEP